MHKTNLIYTLSVLLTLQGCVAEGLEHTDEAGGLHPVGLGAYVQKLSTRADEALLADKTIPGGQSMGVYAYFHDNGTWTGTAQPNFMFNQQAVSNAVTDAFDYSPLKYWPNEEGDKLSFIAYYPYTAYPVGAPYSDSDPDTPTGIKPQLANMDSGLPSFLFKVKSDPAQQVDFMVSDLAANQSDSRATLTMTDRVRLLFRHMTSKIEFRVAIDENIRQDVSHFTVYNLKISNVKTSGRLTPSYDGTQTTFEWTDCGDPMATMSCTLTDSYLLLPQFLDDGMKLTMTYDLTFKSGGTSYEYEGAEPVAKDTYTYKNVDATAQLNTFCLAGTSTPLTEWQPNHHYVYTIRLTARRIEFTGQVVDWGEKVGSIEITPTAS